MSTATENTQEQEVISIEEAQDGSAIVELPPSIPSPEPQSTNDDDHGSDEADEAAREAEIAAGGAVDEEAERLREQKRQKRRARKEYHKQVSVEKDMKDRKSTRLNSSHT